MWAHIFVCLKRSVNMVCVYMHVSMHVRMCAHAGLCVHVCICTCVHVCRVQNTFSLIQLLYYYIIDNVTVQL